MRTILFMLAMPALSHAHEVDERARIRPVEAIRLIAANTPRLPDFRILPEIASDELLPGDRPVAELFNSTVDRPREPGATMRARMSMRLDTGRDAMRPDFALGGIGGAIVRMTDALLAD